MSAKTASQPTPARHPASKAAAAALPQTREALLDRHAELRRDRNAAVLGGPEWAAAVGELARVEVEIARIERAMDPPLA